MNVSTTTALADVAISQPVAWWDGFIGAALGGFLGVLAVMLGAKLERRNARLLRRHERIHEAVAMCRIFIRDATLNLFGSRESVIAYGHSDLRAAWTDARRELVRLAGYRDIAPLVEEVHEALANVVVAYIEWANRFGVRDGELGALHASFDVKKAELVALVERLHAHAED